VKRGTFALLSNSYLNIVKNEEGILLHLVPKRARLDIVAYGKKDLADGPSPYLWGARRGTKSVRTAA